jgi:Tfp pilus assembly protein PilO
MEDILAIVLIFGGGSIFLFAISPIGRAIGDRIRGGARESAADAEGVRRLQDAQQALLDDLEAVRQELAEVQERLDFTERLLAQQRERPGLPEPR